MKSVELGQKKVFTHCFALLLFLWLTTGCFKKEDHKPQTPPPAPTTSSTTSPTGSDSSEDADEVPDTEAKNDDDQNAGTGGNVANTEIKTDKKGHPGQTDLGLNPRPQETTSAEPSDVKPSDVEQSNVEQSEQIMIPNDIDDNTSLLQQIVEDIEGDISEDDFAIDESYLEELKQLKIVPGHNEQEIAQVIQGEEEEQMDGIEAQWAQLNQSYNRVKECNYLNDISDEDKEMCQALIQEFWSVNSALEQESQSITPEQNSMIGHMQSFVRLMDIQLQ